MKAEKQLKNNQYNIFQFIKQVSQLEKNENIVAFLKQEYQLEEINNIINEKIEYHSLFGTKKFDIWLLINKNKLKKSIVYVSVEKLDNIAKKHLNSIRKYAKQIIVEFEKNIKIEDVKQYANSINQNIIVGYTNYDDKNLRKVIMLLGEKFEYKKVDKPLKVLAIIHTYNEEDVIETTINHLLEQGVDIYLLDNWSTDNTYNIAKKIQEQNKERIYVKKFPEEKPKENSYEWTRQLQKTEELAQSLDYDWFIHYDADEIRITPYPNNVKIVDMVKFVDSLGYNAIDTTVIDFRMTDLNDSIFAQNTYFEFGRKPSHFEQLKAWKKCANVDLASSGGHVAKFENQKIYPIKIINKHYPLRSVKQAEKKIYKDRLPRFEKEKKEKGWHSQYDKIAQDKDYIYEKENLNKFEEHTTLEHLTLELISGIGINKI